MSIVRSLIAATSFGALLTSPAVTLAQGSAASRGSSALSTAHGVIIDSLYGGPLRGALVTVDGTSRGAATDATGRFTIDSVPAGAHRLAVMHPLLDTLGIGLATPSITFAPGDTAFLVLATPSVETLARMKCSAAPLPAGRSVLLGLVSDTDSGEPVADATVVLAWSQLEATREAGVRRLSSQRLATTAANGTFRICGVPPDLVGEIFAWRGRDTTAVVRVALENQRLAVRALVFPSKADEVVVDSAATRAAVGGGSAVQRGTIRRGRSVLRGQVTTVTGAAIAGARVSVEGAAGAAVTNDRGEFTLRDQPSGSQNVVVRRLGYEPVEFAVDLSPVLPREVDVQLSEFVPVLETVLVQARRDAGLQRVGFTARQRSAQGRYLSLEDIERRNALRLVDLLANVSGLRAVSTGGSEQTIVGRQTGGGYGCVQYFVDGMPWLGEDSPSDFMSPQEVGAIEVYSDVTTPAEFERGLRGCSTVVIWTRMKLGIR